MFKIKQTNEIEKWRMDTLLTKEPETIAWIDSFTDGQFVDIGANIGLYSLYCAEKHPDMAVLAFEPFLKNYERLVENYQLNGFNNIIAANVAIGNRNGLLKLRHVNEKVGSSGHQVNDCDGVSCACATLDAFKILSKFPLHYIKIDTDGNEYDIIRNAHAVLADPETRGVLIEVNDHKKEITGIFESHGFRTKNRFNKMKPHSRTRRKKEGIKAENIIFTRG